jgi:small subunit ribosomal protein S6
MNIECGNEPLDEITKLFRYNDAVLRNLVIKTKDAVTEESLILKGERENKERKQRAEHKRRLEDEAAARAAEAAGDEDEEEDFDEDTDEAMADE